MASAQPAAKARSTILHDRDNESGLECGDGNPTRCRWYGDPAHPAGHGHHRFGDGDARAAQQADGVGVRLDVRPRPEVGGGVPGGDDLLAAAAREVGQAGIHQGPPAAAAPPSRVDGEGDDPPGHAPCRGPEDAGRGAVAVGDKQAHSLEAGSPRILAQRRSGVTGSRGSARAHMAATLASSPGLYARMVVAHRGFVCWPCGSFVRYGATMNTPPPDLPDQDVRRALEQAWGLRLASLQYVPRGFGSHHWMAGASDGARYFVNVDDLGSKSWFGSGRQAAFDGLRAAFATAVALRQEAGLPFVVAPTPSSAGSPLERLTDRYALSVFPFVEGAGGGYADRMSPEDRKALLRMLGALHQASVSAQPPRRDAEIASRVELQRALGELDQPWGAGPFSEAARTALAGHADTVRRRLAEFDDLELRLGEDALVVTHGEPHPGNVMRSASGLVLVDWDTVALARPERDLWMLDDGSDDCFAAYGRAPDPAAIALYRLAWPLTDVALFTATLRSAHERNADTELAMRSLAGTLRELEP